MIFDGQEIAHATGGTLIRDGVAGPVMTDSRRLRPGEWFLALVGDRFDGHDFLPMAQAAQCIGAVACHVPGDWTAGFVQVEDPLVALQDLGRHVRNGFNGPVIGITGSAGKTTTRAMMGHVLAPLGRVHQTEGNFNNHIGLPLTLIRAPLDATSWVLEMGMNHAGEIDLLQEIARPTIRLITNVGAAHLEGVGSLEGVARAKGELFDGAQPGDVCCINDDDPRISSLPIPPGVEVFRYGSSITCDVRLSDAAVDPATLETRYRVETPHGTVRGTLKSPGLHLAANATATIAVATLLHVPVDSIADALAMYEPVGMRLRVEEAPGDIRVINDAYNANPLSTLASLDTLASLAGPRRVALLGDMLELGSNEDAAHVEILQHALESGIELVGVAGVRYMRAAESLSNPGLVTAPDAATLADAVCSRLLPGDIVLIKGSRGLAMEQIVQALRGDED